MSRSPENPEENPNRRATTPAELRRLSARTRRNAAGIFVGGLLLGGGIMGTTYLVENTAGIKGYGRGVMDGIAMLLTVERVLDAGRRSMERLRSADGYANQVNALERSALGRAEAMYRGMQAAPTSAEQGGKVVMPLHGMLADPDRTGPVTIPYSFLLEGPQPFPTPEDPQTPPLPPGQAPGQQEHKFPPGW